MTGTKTETGGKTGRDKAQEAKDAIVEGSAKVAEKVFLHFLLIIRRTYLTNALLYSLIPGVTGVHGSTSCGTQDRRSRSRCTSTP